MADEESCVRVAVRIRPQSAAEVLAGCGVCARAELADDPPAVALGDRSFAYDYVFDDRSTQQEIYQTTVRPLLEAALDGYNSTVFAYGQTGSGKTYTMGSGWEPDDDPDDRRSGILPRALRDLYADIQRRRQQQPPPDFCVRTQFTELYNEDIVDLLEPGTRDLRLASDERGGVSLLGARALPAPDLTSALRTLRVGALARSTGATRMNTSSSRSHAVFSVLLSQRRVDPHRPDEYETLSAKLHFVDLAGSERLKRTGATGDRAREAIAINCGLLALGNVISALGDRTRKAHHVPYRDSKLTRLLQDSLGGNARTLMIACVSPTDSDFMETLGTLKYSHRARNIRNRCSVNRDLSSDTVRRLRADVLRLQLELAEFQQGARVAGGGGRSDVAQENAVLRAELDALRARADAARATAERLAADNARLRARAALLPPAAAEDDCALAGLVAGYVREIEQLRARLLESAELERRRRPPRAGADSDALLGNARREIELERARLEALRDEEPRTEAEGRSDDDERDPEDEEARDERLAAELAELGERIDTKARLVEELERSQQRLADARDAYERRLVALHRQIRAAEEERDRLAAAGAAGSPAAAGRLARWSREARRLGAARAAQEALVRGSDAALARVPALRDELAGLRAERVRLLRRLREDARVHARERAAAVREVAQLRKESRRNANLVRSLEADRKLKDQVLRRKQEEVSLLRRSRRGGGSGAGWPAVARWLERAAAARALLGDLEVRLQHALAERERASDPEHRAYVEHEVRDIQRQILQLDEPGAEPELAGVVAAVDAGPDARHALEQMALLVLRHAGDAARARRARLEAEAARRLDRAASDTRRALRELREEAARTRPVSPASPASSAPLSWPVRLRSLGVYPAALSQSLQEASPATAAPPVATSLSAPASPSASPPSSPGPRDTRAAPASPGPRAARAAPALARPSPRRDACLRTRTRAASAAPPLSPPPPTAPQAVRQSRVLGPPGRGPVLALCSAPDYPHHVYSGDSDGWVTRWDVTAGQTVWRAALCGPAGTLSAGAGLVAAGGARGGGVLDARGGVLVRGLPGAVHVMLDERGERLWSVSRDALSLWDPRAGLLRRDPLSTVGGVTCAALVPGGPALGRRDGRVQGPGPAELTPPHYDVVTALLLLPDGGLASGSRDRSVRLWDLSASRLLHSRSGAHAGGVSGLTRWGETGLASCGREGTVRLWDSSGAARGEARAPGPLLAALGTPRTPRLLYTAGSDGNIRCWSVT